MNMNKTNYFIALSVALFWACSDSPNEAGTTEIDNTVAQNDSSSSSDNGQDLSSSSSSNKQEQTSSSSIEPNGNIGLSSSKQPLSSDTEIEPSKAFATDTKRGLKISSCIEPALAKRVPLAETIETTSDELPKAYILSDGKGHYQVMALNVNDLCSVSADVLTKRSGDTLQIEYGCRDTGSECVIAESACMCHSDHWFDIEPENMNVKFIQFNGITYETSTGPVPNPSTTVQNDSASAQITVQNDSVLTDTRDGKTYKLVKLGEKIWMAENLNYEIKDSLVSNCDENGSCDMGFPSNRPQSWCNGNEQENCDKYGRLYNFEAAKIACPTGWHLPTVNEWPENGNGGYPAFLDYAVVGWGGGKDTYGFTVLPAGEYKASSQSFLEPGRFAFFWTSTIDNLNHDCPTMIHFGNGSEGMVSVCADDENDGHSVRCVKD